MRTFLIAFFIFGLTIFPLNIPIIRRAIVELVVCLSMYTSGIRWELVWNRDHALQYVLYGKQEKV